MELIQAHGMELLIIAIFVGITILYIAWQIQKKGLKKTVVDFIVEAEELYNQGENEEKITYVIDNIIALIPMPLRLFITTSCVKKFIQKIFDEVKKAVDYMPEGKEK